MSLLAASTFSLDEGYWLLWALPVDDLQGSQAQLQHVVQESYTLKFQLYDSLRPGCMMGPCFKDVL